MNNRFLLLCIFVLGFSFIGCPGTDLGPETKTYTVIIGSLTNGTITANPTSGTEGTEIVLTITPNNGYQLKAGTLKYGTTTIDEAAKKFNLPAQDVTVTAQFEEISIVPAALQGTYRTTTGDRANNPEFDVVITGTILTWANDGPFVIKSVTDTHITIILEEGDEFPIEYELSGNSLRLKDGSGEWQERQKII
jgi:hypothetical protein